MRYLNEISLHAVQFYVDNTTEDVNISPEDKAVFIRYYKCTLAGVVLDWLDTGASYDLLDFCERICQSFEGSGRRAFLKQIQGA